MNIVFFHNLACGFNSIALFHSKEALPLYDIAEDISSILTIPSGSGGTRTGDSKVVSWSPIRAT